MRLKKLLRLKKFKIGYALGEVFLVFIGVSMSLALDQWRSSNAEDETERKLLTEVVQALRSDTLQISKLIEKSSQVSRDARYVLAHLNSDSRLTDSLSINLASVIGIDSYIQDNSGFETLKTSGLTLIDDDSIRISLTRTMLLNDQLEEFGRLGIHSFHANELLPIFNRSLDEWDGYVGVKVKDFAKLKSNFTLRNSIYWWCTINEIHQQASRYSFSGEAFA